MRESGLLAIVSMQLSQTAVGGTFLETSIVLQLTFEYKWINKKEKRKKILRWSTQERANKNL